MALRKNNIFFILVILLSGWIIMLNADDSWKGKDVTEDDANKTEKGKILAPVEFMLFLELL